MRWLSSSSFSSSAITLLSLSLSTPSTSPALSCSSSFRSLAIAASSHPSPSLNSFTTTCSDPSCSLSADSYSPRLSSTTSTPSLLSISSITYTSTVLLLSLDFISAIFSNSPSRNPYQSPLFRKFPTARQYTSSNLNFSSFIYLSHSSTN